MAGWTFAIPTDGLPNPFHSIIFESIRAQKIPEYEIIICAEKAPIYQDQSDIKEIYIDPIKPMWITKKKNECTKNAKFDNICYLHDYISFDSGWYEGYGTSLYGYHHKNKN